jgi:hypothetical protein
MALFTSFIPEHSVRSKHRIDRPLDGRDEFVERRIVTPILDDVTGMADRRAVTTEGAGDLIKRDLKATLQTYMA